MKAVSCAGIDDDLRTRPIARRLQRRAHLFDGCDGNALIFSAIKAKHGNGDVGGDIGRPFAPSLRAEVARRRRDAILALLSAIATPIQNNIIRYHEHQADIFGLNASREPDGFAEAAVLLSEYRKMEPGPFELWFFYDHPSGYDRIHMAMEWKAHEMAAGRYPMGPGGPPPGWRPDFVVVDDTPATAAPAVPGLAPAEEPSRVAP